MIGRLRLISGFILFVFVLGHFLNHAMGIVSLGAMDAGIKYTVEPWRTLPGTIVITAALTTHVLLAIWSIYQKRTFNIARGEIVQILFGILMPIMLAAHVLSARGAYEVYDLEGGYSFQLYSQWVATPIYGFVNAAALLMVWIHACLGWHFWFRLKTWYHRFKLALFCLALLVPTLALTGIISGGFRVLRLSNSEKWVSRVLKNISNEAEGYTEFVFANEDRIQLGILILLTVLFSIYLFRKAYSALPGGETMTYRDASFKMKRKIKLRSDTTALDLIRLSKIPHASVCGGRGRCSTCRVRIDDGLDDIAVAGDEEKKVLERIGAPPNVRLACQLKPNKNISLTAMLASGATPRDAHNSVLSKHGDEQDVTILFADIRAFTKLSETQLPYDTAFLLNRYFAAMGKAIEESGGHLDKFIGDGVMAIFGIDKPMETGAQEAVLAAKAMSTRLEKLNETLIDDIDEPLKIGIGIHCGKAIVGNMGYNRAVSLTAIGDVVNTASRLESLTKDLDAQLVVSKKTAEFCDFNFSQFTPQKVNIRGRVDALEVHAIQDASLLS